MHKQVLVVEDDPISQDLIRLLCEAKGYRVDVACDGFLGLRLLSEAGHRLALVDYHLPEMDGYALARLMREIGDRGGEPLRLIAMTSDKDGLAARRGADKLFDAVLPKPLDPEALLGSLEPHSRLSDRAADTSICMESLGGGGNAGDLLDIASVLWRRRGLKGRPTIVAFPAATTEQAEALSQCFDLAASPDKADLVLVLNEGGLEGLAQHRRSSASQLIPSADLSGHLQGSCDTHFKIDDPASWSMVAEAQLSFAMQRSRLIKPISSFDPISWRLMSLLVTAGKEIVIQMNRGDSASEYVTGYSGEELTAAIVRLELLGFVSCRHCESGVNIAVSPRGVSAVTNDETLKRIEATVDRDTFVRVLGPG
ncbi:response regulator [Methylobacterium iners]|uniref:Sensor histidine kinase RcsC n=1 Tax=Methylobacterium iners TaxID=418707 RepID=A0ABQ4S0Z8_9HYPH|nr:response regulator [Methylobacterium iners]GJD95852.1 Sensor histidine kinase RcsC [Methylobacterium iners]